MVKQKKLWQEKKIQSFGNDTGSVWKNVKTWLGWSSGGSPTRLVDNGSVYNKPKDLCRIMNNYFVNKVRILRENLPRNPGDPLALVRKLMRNRNCSMRLKCVHPDQVLKIISNLKTSSSCGLDSIDSRILKLAKFLSRKLQMSFIGSGTFYIRGAWKIPGRYRAQFLLWFKEL